MRHAVITLIAFLCPMFAAADPLNETPERISRSAPHNSDRPSFIVVPIPIADPAIGTGLGIGAVALYNQDESGRPWTTGIGGLYTDSESWGVAAFHKARFANDRYRLSAAIGYGDFNVSFYGIGQSAGSRDVSIDLNQVSAGGVVAVLQRVRPNLYLGLRYRGARIDTTIDTSSLPFSDLALPDIELESTISALGLATEYDTRDSEYNPRQGRLVEAQWMHAASVLGSDFEYPRATLAINGYENVGEQTTIGWRASFCWSGDSAPFYDLCNFGAQNDLRGYAAGQYRDHAMFAVQAELRRHLFWRIGGTVFVGVGEVAPSFGDFDTDTLLPAAGIGLRIEASRRFRMNISIDIAAGEDSSAVYFYVGEAF